MRPPQPHWEMVPRRPAGLPEDLARPNPHREQLTPPRRAAPMRTSQGALQDRWRPSRQCARPVVAPEAAKWPQLGERRSHWVLVCPTLAFPCAATAVKHRMVSQRLGAGAPISQRRYPWGYGDTNVGLQTRGGGRGWPHDTDRLGRPHPIALKHETGLQPFGVDRRQVGVKPTRNSPEFARRVLGEALISHEEPLLPWDPGIHRHREKMNRPEVQRRRTWPLRLLRFGPNDEMTLRGSRTSQMVNTSRSPNARRFHRRSG